MAEDYIGELVSLTFIAIALGMDAFSVSLGIGMQKIRLKRIALISITMGIFHVIMPFAGIVLGQAISSKIGNFAALAGGLLMVGIGALMFFSAFNHEVKKIIEPVGFGLLLLAATVSIDSFSLGLSLGMSGAKVVLTLIVFCVVTTFLTLVGMLLGRKVRGVAGVYSELLGGSILFGFGLHILFG